MIVRKRDSTYIGTSVEGESGTGGVNNNEYCCYSVKEG